MVVDCIEFNAEFRRVDVLDELSFLETECARLNAAATGAAIREKCMAISGDTTPKELATFYKSYRACVRAKVALLRAKQLADSAAQDQLAIAGQYLELADQFDRPLGPPLVLLVRGLSGTGKSTIAEGLADRLGIELLQTDVVRQELVNLGRLPGGPAKYSPSNRQQVYDQMLASAEELLAGRMSAILDGTFLSQQEIARVGQLVERYLARWLIVHCQCPLGVAQQRIAARRNRGRTLSEARPDLVEEQLTARESNHPSWPAMPCDTTRPAAVLISEILQRLRRP